VARLAPASIAQLAIVGAAIIAAAVLARPEPAPTGLVPPARSAAAQANPRGAEPAPTSADPGADPDDEPVHGRTLSRQDLETALLKVRSHALACRGEGAPPVVELRIGIAPSGQVTQVGLPPEVRNTRAGECITRAIRGASFPSWNAPPVPQVEWTYPLRFDGAE
jgi:hypothetical protein